MYRFVGPYNIYSHILMSDFVVATEWHGDAFHSFYGHVGETSEATRLMVCY